MNKNGISFTNFLLRSYGYFFFFLQKYIRVFERPLNWISIYDYTPMNNSISYCKPWAKSSLILGLFNTYGVNISIGWHFYQFDYLLALTFEELITYLPPSVNIDFEFPLTNPKEKLWNAQEEYANQKFSVITRATLITPAAKSF